MSKVNCFACGRELNELTDVHVKVMLRRVAPDGITQDVKYAMGCCCEGCSQFSEYSFADLIERAQPNFLSGKEAVPSG